MRKKCPVFYNKCKNPPIFRWENASDLRGIGESQREGASCSDLVICEISFLDLSAVERCTFYIWIFKGILIAYYGKCVGYLAGMVGLIESDGCISEEGSIDVITRIGGADLRKAESR